MPYGRAKNPEVVERVQRGQILGQPSNCPNKVYEVREIWNISDWVTWFDLAGDEVMLGHGTRGQAKLQNYQGEAGCHQPRLERGLATIVESEKSILYSWDYHSLCLYCVQYYLCDIFHQTYYIETIFPVNWPTWLLVKYLYIHQMLIKNISTFYLSRSLLVVSPGPSLYHRSQLFPD